MNHHREYKTNNFYLAAYLICNELFLINIDKTDPKKALFVFLDRPDREQMVWDFLYAEEALIDARKYSTTLKELKNKLYT